MQPYSFLQDLENCMPRVDKIWVPYHIVWTSMVSHHADTWYAWWFGTIKARCVPCVHMVLYILQDILALVLHRYSMVLIHTGTWIVVLYDGDSKVPKSACSDTCFNKIHETSSIRKSNEFQVFHPSRSSRLQKQQQWLQRVVAQQLHCSSI